MTISTTPGPAATATPTGPSPAPPVAPRRSKPGELLARLGGADPAVLPRVPGRDRSRFVQMGLVLLSTAGLAVLSMSFALTDGLRLAVFVAVACGVVWGFIILNLDRMLILNLDPSGGPWRVLAMIAPRILIAALLGIVISTPLVLRVFQTEIQANTAFINAQRSNDFGQVAGETGVADELARVRKDIATNEGILRGAVPGLTTPEIGIQQQRVTDAQNAYQQQKQASDAAYRKWQCELFGQGCEGATTHSGNGQLAKSLEKQYRDAQAVTDQAQQTVTDAQAELKKAQDAGGEITQKSADDARATAEQALPGLRDREKQLVTRFNQTLDDGSDRIQDDVGLLAQITSLNDLGDKNTAARWTHIAVGLLFFMIELLPVLVKIMTSLGPPSVYEQVRELDDVWLLDNARNQRRSDSTQRDENDHRIRAEAQKQRKIEDDMRSREQALAIQANGHVATEMSKILDVALTAWSADVRRTLGGAGPTANGGAATTPLPVVGPTGVPAPRPSPPPGTPPAPTTAPPPTGTGGTSGPTTSGGGSPTSAPGGAPPTVNGAPTPSGAPAPTPGGPPPVAPDPGPTTLRNGFNLPDGNKL